MKTWIRVVGLAVAVAVLAGGCVFSPKKTKPEETSEWLPQSSPAYCLANLQNAYLKRSFNEYLKLFATDFTFVFSPADVGDPVDPTPASWGLDEERDTHEKMFSSDLLDRIQLSFEQDAAEESNDEFPDTWKVNVHEINLILDTRKENNEVWIYKVVDGQATFYFKQYPNEKASDGRPLFRIWRWEDQPIGGLMARAE